MAASFVPAERIEGLSEPAQRELARIQRAIKADLDKALAAPSTPELKSGGYLAVEGEHVRVAPRVGGFTLLLPTSRRDNQGAEVRILVERVDLGTVTVQSVGGTVLGQASAVLDAVGLVIATSNGQGDWSLLRARPDGLERIGEIADDTMIANVSGASAVPAQRALSAMVDDSSLEYDATNHRWRVKDLGITTAKLAASSVTTAKFADEGVTLAKLAHVQPGRVLGRQVDAGSAGDPVELTGLEQGENARFAASHTATIASGSHPSLAVGSIRSHALLASTTGDATVHGIDFSDDDNDGHLLSIQARGNANDDILLPHDSGSATNADGRFFNPGGRTLKLSGTHDLEGVLTCHFANRHIPIAFIAPAHVNTTAWVAGQLIVHDGDKDVRTTALHLEGNGSPEGAVSAPVGSVFHRLNGGAGTSFYVKESGTGNTGWVAK